jgi:formate/nitrite transporter
MFAPISILNGEATVKGLMKNWSLVYVGNFLGSIFVAFFLAYLCGFFDNLPWAGWAATVANTKCGLDFETAFLRGIGCNWLVCLAVWLAISSEDVISKIFACWFPIMAFVAIGFEHSVANMFFIPWESSQPMIHLLRLICCRQCGYGQSQLVQLFITNLIFVKLGNIERAYSLPHSTGMFI